MNTFIKELLSKTGETLFNVPADVSVLTEMGFTFAEAETICNTAIEEDKWLRLRNERGHRIAVTDWTQMPDSPLTAEQKTLFAEYRQALRDLPQSTDNPDDIIWPVKPE